MSMEDAVLQSLDPTCPKALGGDSFRAPATLRDGCTGKVHATIDFEGGGYNYTVAP
jgi:hypothetical protein